MRYTQKDVCRAFNIKRDTLRHYERMGIISPHVDERNGYRYYDDWQINLLWDCKRYQGMGFSLAQVRDILHTSKLEDVESLVDERLARMERELEYQAMALDSMRRYQAMLKEINRHMGSYQIRELPALCFVARREVHDLLLDERLTTAGAFMNSNLPVCLPPVAYFPNAREERYYWGFAMLGERYDALSGPNEGMLTLPATRVLSTCVDAGERWNFGAHLFDDLVAEASRRKEEPTGPLYGFLLTRVYDDRGAYHRYVEACLPLAGVVCQGDGGTDTPRVTGTVSFRA